MVSTHSWKAPSSPSRFGGFHPATSSSTPSSSSSVFPSNSGNYPIGGTGSSFSGSGVGAGFGAAATTAFGSPSFGAPSPVSGTTPSKTMSGSSLFGGTSFSSGYPSPFIGGGGTATSSLSGTKGILRNGGGAPSGFGGGIAGGTTSSAADVDFESLLAHSSSQLSSLGRGFGGPKERGASSDAMPSSTSFPLGNKSLLELSLASRGGMGSAANHATTSTTATTYESEAKAHRFLAREGRGFDSAQLGRSARDLERLSGSAAATAPPVGHTPAGTSTRTPHEGEEERERDAALRALGSLRGTTLEEILARHSEYVVRSALRTSRAWTVEQERERAERRLEDDWERERREILGRGVLGNRFLMAGGGGDAGGEGRDDEMGRLGFGDGVSRMLLLEHGGGSGGYGSSNIVPSPQLMPRTLDPLISTHLGAVAAHLKNNPHGGSKEANSVSRAMALITSLREGMESPLVWQQQQQQPQQHDEITTSYINAVAFLESILYCSVNLGLEIEPSPPTGGGNVALSVMGACNFFSNQFRDHVVKNVREAEFAGHARAGGKDASRMAALTPMARDVTSYAAIIAGSDLVDGAGGMWPMLFYCLRCGDANAAKSVIAQFGNIGGNIDNINLIDPAVSDLIFQLADMQKRRDTIFGDANNNSPSRPEPQQHSMLSPSQAMMQSRRVISDLYERVKTRMTTSSSELEPTVVYQAACLAMLSGAESISEASCLASSGIVRTVEDYLYASLWYALHLSNSASSAGGASNGNKMEAAISRLGMLVNEWGPSYFEEDDGNEGFIDATDAVASRSGDSGGARNEIPRSGGWAYAFPLLASQQYASALAYLAEAGGGLGLLQATHVALIMDAMGLPIDDFSLDGRDKSSTTQTLFPMLVTSYSASLQGSDAGAALQYLMVLNRQGSLIKEQVQRLLLETRQFEIMAGKIEADGSKTNAALDAHFSKTEISSILADAASNAMRAGKAADAAELLVLSGKFSSLFMLMNRELASYLVVSTQEDFDKRQFWFNAASQFHQVHLSPGKTYVVDTLNEEGCMSLGNTFQLLMNLVVFFDRCRDQQWEGAWDLMDNLQLLPKNDSEMTVKVETFQALDSCVRQVFHHVILASMESLCHIYKSLKQAGSSMSFDQRNTVEHNLMGLQTRARLLVTFSRLINLPNSGNADTFVRLSQLEKNMM